MVSVDILPPEPLLDDPLTIRVTGIESGQALRLRTRMRGPDDQPYESVTTVSGEDGTATIESNPGDLNFLTDMESIDDSEEVPASFPELLLIGETPNGSRLFREGVTRRSIRPGITVERVTRDGFVADFYRPSSGEPHPGVVFLGGSGGGLPPAYRAELLASRGYAVLSTAYFGLDDLPETLTEVPVENVANALTFLTSHEATTDALGIVGGSRGSELGLLLAAKNPAVDCVVGYVASGIVWESAGERSAWTIDGNPHPYLAGDFSDIAEQDGPVRFDEGHRTTLVNSDQDAIEAATIPVEEADAAMLLFSGGDDRLWPSADLADRVVDRLDNVGFDREYEHVCYPDAGHQIRVPFLPAHGRESGGELPDGREMAYGGTPEGYAAADYDSWRRALAFLNRHLA